MLWPTPQFKQNASADHVTLAALYARLRQVCTEICEFAGSATESGLLTEKELKHVDFGTVCLRIGYKQLKGVLEKAGAETGRRKLKGADR